MLSSSIDAREKIDNSKQVPIRVATAKKLMCERKCLCKVLVSAKKYQCLANQSGLISNGIRISISLLSRLFSNILNISIFSESVPLYAPYLVYFHMDKCILLLV